MDIHEHYPQRTVTINPGDIILATYQKPAGSPFNASTLKRLFGWVNGWCYIGRARRDGEGKIVVDFYKEGARPLECTHAGYNVEVEIAKGALTDLRHRPNPSPSLFDI